MWLLSPDSYQRAFNDLPHVASMPERVPSRLRPHREPVWLASNRNPVSEFSRRRVEDVDLVVIAARDPKLLSVSGDVAHVRTPAARNRPVRDYSVVGGIEHAD